MGCGEVNYIMKSPRDNSRLWQRQELGAAARAVNRPSARNPQERSVSEGCGGATGIRTDWPRVVDSDFGNLP